MKKITVLACSLFMAVVLVLGITSTLSSDTVEHEVCVCDMDYGRVCF